MHAGCYYAVLPAALEPVPLFYSLAGYLDIPDERPLTAGTSSLDLPKGSSGHHPATNRDETATSTHLLNATTTSKSVTREHCSYAAVQAYLADLGQAPEAAWPAAGGAAALELLVHCAWLVYEEAWVIQDVLRRCVHIEEAITLSFISVTYHNPQSVEEGAHIPKTLNMHPALMKHTPTLALGLVHIVGTHDANETSRTWVGVLAHLTRPSAPTNTGRTGASPPRAWAGEPPVERCELALDTHCFLARAGDAVILAFRGSLPMDFLDWFCNFSWFSCLLTHLPLTSRQRRELRKAAGPHGRPPVLTACAGDPSPSERSGLQHPGGV